MNSITTETRKIFLVDDHKMVRDGLRNLIQQQPGMEVVGEADGAVGALEEVQRATPDIVLVDVNLGDGDGIELSRQLLALQPKLKIVILSGMLDDSLVQSALKAGAHGFLLKTNAAREVMDAIESVAAGRSHLCRHASEALVRNYKAKTTQEAAACTLRVTQREREVWKLTAEGFRMKEIASLLGIEVKTVETHRAHLMKKLQCNSTAGLTRLAIKQGVCTI